MQMVKLALLGLGATACSAAIVSFECRENEPLCDFVDIVDVEERKVATGIDISRVALYQAVEIDLMRDGEPVEASGPIIAGRQAMIRIFVEVDDDFVDREITAVLTVYDGESKSAAGQADLLIDGSSEQQSMVLTWNFNIPGEAIGDELALKVELVEVDEKVSHPGREGRVTWPETEELPTWSTLDVGSTLRLTLVPIRYTADGSNRVPTLDEAEVAAYRERMLAIYPIPDVEVTVAEPFDYDRPIVGYNANSIAEVLYAVGNGVPRDADEYVHGLFEPAATFADFCYGGCVAGISSGAFVSVGVGYPNDTSSDSAGVMQHEVGHSHTLAHAPCGGAAGPDPLYPYSGAGIGSWGYDLFTEELKDPEQLTDVMSYCWPQWISDYNFEKLAERVGAVNASAGALVIGEPVREIWFMPDGTARWGARHTAVIHEAYPERRTLRVRDADGFEHVLDVPYSPLHHVSGGIALVPDSETHAQVMAPESGRWRAIVPAP